MTVHVDRPALATEELRASARRHLLLHLSRNGPHEPAPLIMSHGEGPWLYDTDGNRYLDGISSLYCAQLGYSYGDEFGAVAAAQLAELPFCTVAGVAHPRAIDLAERLAALAPDGLNRVFFTCSGGEAVEVAWKLVRYHFLAHGEPRRTVALARHTAYHGSSAAALSFTGIPAMREPLDPPAVPTVHVANTKGADAEQLLGEYEDAIERTGADRVAMLIAEPVQNTGGCLVPPPGYWRHLRRLCDRYGIVLVADEVVTGFGRLGEWFGGTRYGAAPDIAVVSKGLTSAHAPLGAAIVSDRIAAAIREDGRTLHHGVTFGGHPASAAIALKNIEIFERDGVLENVRANEAYLRASLEALRAIPIVGDVRGAGYFYALALQGFEPERRERLMREFLPQRMREEGLIVRPSDRGDPVLQLAPPLICDRSELDELVARTAAVLDDASAWFARR